MLHYLARRTAHHCHLKTPLAQFTASFGLFLLAGPLQQQAQSFSTSSSSFFRYPNMNSITERDGKGTITMTPKNEADQSALLVICHGLGDTSDGFDDVADVRVLTFFLLFCCQYQLLFVCWPVRRVCLLYSEWSTMLRLLSSLPSSSSKLSVCIQ